MKGTFNRFGTLHHLILRNCHSYPNLQQLSTSRQDPPSAKRLRLAEAQMMVSIFSNKVFFN
jgi:hypothetical protein